MKSIFLKEWRQGYLIVVFGLLMGGLITALWGLFTAFYVDDWKDQEAIDTLCGTLCFIVPVILAVFVGSGLFASEQERGTMPLLLALPVSRRQIWWGKLLAGIALTISAVVLVLVPATIAVRSALEEVDFWAVAPDLALLSVLGFAFAFFWSAVCATIVSAFLSAFALTVAVAIASIAVTGLFGGRILGAPLMDVEIWSLVWGIAFVGASHVGFVRGEPFGPGRRWARPVLLAVAAALVLSIPVIAYARSISRYERAAVRNVGSAHLTGGGSVVSLEASGQPIHSLRELEKRWHVGRLGWRSVFSVALDLDTGKELLVRRETRPSTVSPDGTLAAVLLGPRPLSWRGDWRSFSARTLEIWDLAAGTLQYRGLPGEASEGPAPSLQWAAWSADGTWLSLAEREKWDPDEQREMRRLILMRPNGSEAHEVRLWDTYEAATWTWAATGSSLLWLDQDGSLIRYDPKTRQQQALWQAPRPEDMPDWAGLADGRLTNSPDGGLIAVNMTYDLLVASVRYGAARPVPGREYVRRLWVVSSDGEEARMVETPATLNAGHHQIWSTDGTTLYRDQRVLGEDGRTAIPEILAWNAAEGTPARAILPEKEWPEEILAVPTGGVLVRTPKRIWEVTPEGRAFLASEKVQRALGPGRWLGLDDRGRVITQRWDPDHSAWILAIDPATGEQTSIYP